MSKKTIILLIAGIMILGIGGYFLWTIYLWPNFFSPESRALKSAGKAAEAISESATQGVLPSIDTNPLENKPDINPADKVNPFKDVKTNPFE